MKRTKSACKNSIQKHNRAYVLDPLSPIGMLKPI